MRLRNYLLGILGVLLLGGCASSVNSLNSLNLLQNSFADGKSKKEKSVKEADSFGGKDYLTLYKKYKESNISDDLLKNYEAGMLGYLVKEYEDSVKFYDNAEKLIKKYDEEVLSSKLLSNVGSVLTNDAFMDYRPKIYEKILVNTYKGIDFIALKKARDARVEFNRALVRQDRAKEFFKKEIEKERREINRENREKLKDKKVKDSFSIDSIVKNKKTTDPIEKEYSNLFRFKAYRDFINPFTSYIAGIYFLNVRDYAKATDLLKETYGMIKGLDEGAKYVLRDFKLARSMKRSLRSRKRHYTWVVFLNGLGPIKEEIKIDVPLFLFSNDVLYTGIALPKLKMRSRAYKSLRVRNSKRRGVLTKRITSMDRIVKSEFKKRFPTIMTRALTRTVVQTLIQKKAGDKLENHFGTLGFLAKGVMAATQYALNRADTRMWKSIPKEFQVARVKTTRRLRIEAGGREIFSLKTNPKKNYIVFVTIPTKEAKPVVTYQSF